MRAAWALAVLAAASPALAQQRPPAARQALVVLSKVLGESHAIRRACEGADDQFWRGRMQRLLDVETQDPGLKTQLSVAFNEAYNAGQAHYPKCSALARAEARRIARAGRTLSDRLEQP